MGQRSQVHIWASHTLEETGFRENSWEFAPVLLLRESTMSNPVTHPFPALSPRQEREQGGHLGDRCRYFGERMRMGMRSSPEHGRGGGCQHLAAIGGPGQIGDTTTPKPLQLDTGLGGNIPHLGGDKEDNGDTRIREHRVMISAPGETPELPLWEHHRCPARVSLGVPRRVLTSMAMSTGEAESSRSPLGAQARLVTGLCPG